MNIGIVGHEGAKFTNAMKELARNVIRDILIQPVIQSDGAIVPVLVSGGCHLGGVDIWAEEIANQLGLPMIIHKPEKLSWNGYGRFGGYKDRNLAIAKDSDVVHCIVVEGYHEGYKGMRFNSCYHCNSRSHVKSGGCWTAKRAKEGVWHVIPVC